MNKVPVQQHRKVLGMKPILYTFDFLVPYIDLYSEEQMKEVFLGVQGFQKQRDIELYYSPDYSPELMHQIRLALDENMPTQFLETILNPDLSWVTLRTYRHLFKDHPDIFNYIN